MKFYQIILIIFINVALYSTDTSALQITEIMFNPQGADSGREWIEVRLNSSDICINLTEYRLFEEGINHNIYRYDSDMFCEYAIISSDPNKFLQDYTYLNKTDTYNQSKIQIFKSSFSLNNDGEIIAIKKGSEIHDEMNYSMLIATIETVEGYSFEYADSSDNNISGSGFWKNSDLLKGDPGNIVKENLSLEENSSNDTTMNISTTINDNTTNNSTSNETIQTYNDSDINTTETANTSNNTTEFNNNTNSAIDLCNIALKIFIKNSSIIYENDVAIKFQNKIEIDNSSSIDKEYAIEYWVEDLFGNIIKNKISTTNQGEKSFTPKIEEADKILLIKSEIKNISCHMTNTSISYAQETLLIKNSNYVSKQSCPSCPVCSKASCEPAICTKPYTNHTNNSCPVIYKTLNVCNTSKDNQEKQECACQDYLSQTYLDKIRTQGVSNVSTIDQARINQTQKTGQTTSMVIYESPNLKNRMYALIGLIFVGVTCIGMIVYKIRNRIILKKNDTNTDASTILSHKSKR